MIVGGERIFLPHLKQSPYPKTKSTNMSGSSFANTTQHGAIEGKTQTHDVEYFNLEVITSVGYRVKSQRGVQFRRLIA